MRIAFATLRHDHIFVLYEMAKQNELFEICGAYEDDEAAIKKATDRGLDVCYKTYEELLSDASVDAVVIGNSYGQRGEMAISALEHGKHVICDKPLCTSLDELDRIEALAKEKGLLVSCMYTMRFEEKIVSVKALIESGALGEINNVYFGGQHPLQYGRRPAWYFEEGKHGGVINDIAIHGIDILSFLFGGKLKTIQGARCWNKYAECEPNFKDCGQFMITLDNGAGVVSDISYAIPDGVEFALPYYWQFYIWGTKGTVAFSLNEGETQYFVKGEKEPKTLEKVAVKTDYLTDFYKLVKGENDVVLPMCDVFESTRSTLKIQEFANK